MLMWALKRKYSFHKINAKHLFIFLPMPTLLPTAASVAADLKTQLTLLKKFCGLKSGEKPLNIQTSRSNGLHALWCTKYMHLQANEGRMINEIWNTQVLLWEFSFGNATPASSHYSVANQQAGKIKAGRTLCYLSWGSGGCWQVTMNHSPGLMDATHYPDLADKRHQMVCTNIWWI